MTGGGGSKPRSERSQHIYKSITESEKRLRSKNPRMENSDKSQELHGVLHEQQDDGSSQGQRNNSLMHHQDAGLNGMPMLQIERTTQTTSVLTGLEDTRLRQSYNSNENDIPGVQMASTDLSECMVRGLNNMTVPTLKNNNQGFYTGLLLEQIRYSQEEVEVGNNTQDPLSSYMDLLTGKIDFQMDASPEYLEGNNQNKETSEHNGNSMLIMPEEYEEEPTAYLERVSYEDNGGAYGHNAERTENTTDDVLWRGGIFSTMQVDEISASTEYTAEQSDAAEVADQEHDGIEGVQNGSQELTEEFIDEFIRSEQLAASEGNNADIDSKYTPQIEMEFKSREDATHFFSFYGFLAGFEIVIAHVYRRTAINSDKEIYKQEMKCHRHGKPPPKKKKNNEIQDTLMMEAPNQDKETRKTNVQVKTDCKCVMVVKEEGGIWRVVRLDLDHNHELSPESRNQLFSGRKYMTDMEKGVIRTLNDNNIPTRKMIAILSYLRGGLTALPFKTKDVQNFRTKINREVTGSDMNQAMAYFRKREAEDPTFFFRFQVDNTMKVKNIFWRDGVSLEWYAKFGDCVSFDTTYMTNLYNLPFAPFVGITEHAHTCLFGCAFLSDETKETFKWVFETFVESMGGKHPKSIITDQDKAMRWAIEKVFPDSRHRNCFFHIKSKCYNKNLKCFSVNEGLPEKFEDIINFSITEEEFEIDWQEMIAEFKLEKNKYFDKMWQNRKRFIPVYYKNDFFPFIQSTGRSEGTNARFKDNVGPTYSIVSFLREYQRIVDVIKNNERIEDNQNKQKRPKEMHYGYTIQHQAMEVYNRNIYLKFCNQLKLTEMYKYKETVEGSCFEVWYKSNQIQKQQKIRKYIVLTDLREGMEEFSCICGKFSKDGILCSHILKVIVEEEINKIPEKYFIDRWRKKDKKIQLPTAENKSETHSLLRFNMLSRQAAKITSKAARKDKATEYLAGELERIDKHLDMLLLADEEDEELEPSTSESQKDNHMQTSRAALNDKAIVVLQDPERVQQKGRPKNPTRLVPMVEQERAKMAKAAAKKQKKTATNSSPQGKTKKRVKKGAQGNGAE